MEGLPEGLVTTTGKLSSELNDPNLVRVEDILKLWKVYHANPRVLEDNVGYRLENLFWRIWGSKRILDTIRGSTLAQLFSHVSQPGPSSLASLKKLIKMHESSKKQIENKESGRSMSGSGTSRSPLPPILKKPSAVQGNPAQGESQKKTRLLITDLGGQNATRKPSNPPTPVTPNSSTGDMTNRQNSKKTYFVASKPGKGAKRRPGLVRRKSSQPSSGTNFTRAQSPHPKPAEPPSENELKPEKGSEKDEDDKEDESKWQWADDLPLPNPALNVKPGALPSSFVSSLKLLLSTQNIPPSKVKSSSGYCTPARRDLTGLSPASFQPSSQSLVEKDFRTRFAEKVRQEQLSAASYFNSMNPYNQSGTETNGTYSSPPYYSGDGLTPPASSTVPAISCNDFSNDQNPGGLPTPVTPGTSGLSPFQTPTMSIPRPRSQLSLLIEQSRSSTKTLSCGHTMVTDE
ncbi:hypothetical protein MW887_011802 [Aspergillus wentii]|nr:hypothetical protein MW887_011802 [Aspergillus wentii]